MPTSLSFSSFGSSSAMQTFKKYNKLFLIILVCTVGANTLEYIVDGQGAKINNTLNWSLRKLQLWCTSPKGFPVNPKEISSY